MKIRRRKENRLKPVMETEIAIYLHGTRLEGTVLDVTEAGLGTLFPETSEFKLGQSVQSIYRRERRIAKIVRVSPTDDGVQLGLKFV